MSREGVSGMSGSEHVTRGASAAGELSGPRCILPGCRNGAEEQGLPCGECAEAFGSHLRQTDGPAMTVEAQAKRDNETQAAYAVLLAGGAKGKRFALPHARMMMHQPFGGVSGQISDIEIQANEILRMRQLLNEVLADHTGQDIERIAKDTDRDFFLGAKEAVEYGLVDEILTRPPMEVEEDED